LFFLSQDTKPIPYGVDPIYIYIIQNIFYTNPIVLVSGLYTDRVNSNKPNSTKTLLSSQKSLKGKQVHAQKQQTPCPMFWIHETVEVVSKKVQERTPGCTMGSTHHEFCLIDDALNDGSQLNSRFFSVPPILPHC